MATRVPTVSHRSSSLFSFSRSLAPSSPRRPGRSSLGRIAPHVRLDAAIKNLSPSPRFNYFPAARPAARLDVVIIISRPPTFAVGGGIFFVGNFWRRQRPSSALPSEPGRLSSSRLTALGAEAFNFAFFPRPRARYDDERGGRGAKSFAAKPCRKLQTDYKFFPGRTTSPARDCVRDARSSPGPSPRVAVVIL